MKGFQEDGGTGKDFRYVNDYSKVMKLPLHLKPCPQYRESDGAKHYAKRPQGRMGKLQHRFLTSI